MPVTFSAVSPCRHADVVNFLTGVFRMTEIPLNLRHDALRWKFSDPHPWWPDGRCYVLETEHGIAAHASVAPARYRIGDAEIESGVFLDWASGGPLPGAGMLILRRLLESAVPTVLGVGGTDDNLRVITRLKWFERKEDVRMYARPLHAWRRWAHSPKTPREIARFGRNLLWQLSPPLPRCGAWTCREARPGEPVFSPRTSAYGSILRTREWFDYLLRCPVLPTRLLILENQGIARGHAFLSFAAGTVRVADFVVADEACPAERVAAFSALVRYVATESAAVEITAASSIAENYAIFEKCGLRLRHSTMVHLADPRKLFPPGARVEIAPLLGDAFYFYEPSSPAQFLC